MFDVTVAICTAGERDTLDGTLRSLVAQEIPASLGLEILVVDNSRSDTGFVERVTAEIARATRLPLRRVRESRVGLGFARNAAIAAARGEIVAFVDDDVIVDPTWASELVGAYQGTGAAAAGGRIDPIWAGERPRWLGDHLLGYLSILDYGLERTACHYPHYPYGANISFRRDVLIELGGFRTTLGGGGAPTYLMDEIDVCRRVEKAGQSILYVPSARVQHIIPASRLTRDFFLKRAAVLGRATARMGSVAGDNPRSPLAVVKGLSLAAIRAGRHGARIPALFLARRETELMSECRHLVWNLAWMWEITTISTGGS